MSIRRLNYTGRKKIRREDVSITLYEKPNEKATFDADLTKLTEYKLTDEAVVSVEARLQTRWMRFGFGTVGVIKPAPDRTLTEFDSAEGILFSVKVTAASGKLLAEVDSIPVRFSGEVEELRIGLLPVKAENIGHEVYRVQFSDTSTPPLLLVNKAAGDKDAIARSPLFMSMVYPAALREILVRIIRVEGLDDTDDDGDTWQARWLKFATSLPGVGDLPPEENEGNRDQWIDDAVAAFAKQKKMVERFTAAWQKEGA